MSENSGNSRKKKVERTEAKRNDTKLHNGGKAT